MTTTAQPSIACARVIDTIELLEAILLEVYDYTTVLHAQRVDSTFRACIKNSPRLQEKLFFKPRDERTVPGDMILVNSFLWYGQLPATYSDHDDASHPRTYSQIEFIGNEILTLQNSFQENPNYSCFNMHLIEPIGAFIKIRVSYSLWAATMKVKQQSYRDTIALATSLRTFAVRKWRTANEHITQLRRALMARRPVPDQPKMALWEDFFTEEQKEMIVSDPMVFWTVR